MANYPAALPQERDGSEEQVRDPLLLSISRAGGAKGRRLQPAKKMAFTIVHKGLTVAEKGTLQTFFDANRAVSFVFAWNDAPGTTFTVIFADPEGLRWRRGKGTTWNVTVPVIEV